MKNMVSPNMNIAIYLKITSKDIIKTETGYYSVKICKLKMQHEKNNYGGSAIHKIGYKFCTKLGLF